MAKMVWKLVRDNIPDIIRAEGKEPETRVLEGHKYTKALQKKLDEEVKELKQVFTLHHNEHLTEDATEQVTEELADVLEVLAAMTEVTGISTDYLFEIADAKRKERGAFLKGIELKVEKK